MALTPEDRQWIEDMIAARLEAMETRLLTAFHGWASPVEVKARSHSAALRALDVQVESLEDRVTKLESGKETGR